MIILVAMLSEQMIIMAGEQSGRLESTLLAVVDVVQASRRIKSVIVSGVAYPLAVLAAAATYVWLFGTQGWIDKPST